MKQQAGLSPNEKFMLMQAAFERLEMDKHCVRMEKLTSTGTIPSKMAYRYCGQKGLPVKLSWLYCDQFDVTFYYTNDGRADATYCGCVHNGCADLEEFKLIKAVQNIRSILKVMQEVSDEHLKHRNVSKQGEEEQQNETL